MDDQARNTYRKFVDGLWGKPESPKIMATGLLAGISMSDVMAAADARPTLPPLSATDRLQRNLERTVSESTARAEVLRQEIAAREAELADVLRAEEAARIALGNLTETGHVPYAEERVEWPQATPPGWDKDGSVAPITEDDLSAACGLALAAADLGEIENRYLGGLSEEERGEIAVRLDKNGK